MSDGAGSRLEVRGLTTTIRLITALGALAALGFLAASTAVAQPARAPIAVTIDPVISAGRWDQGWFGLKFSSRKGSLLVTTRGTVSISGTVDTATTLRAVLRRVDRSGPPTAQATFAAGPGLYSTTLRLPIRPLPGTYRVTVGVVTPAGAVVGKVVRDFEFAAPPEGIVGSAEISATKRGPARTVLRSRHRAYARFHFVVPPSRGRKVTIQWRTPNNELICQTKSGRLKKGCRLPLPYGETVYTYLRSSVEDLDRGNWYCELSVNGRLARRAFVRLR
jgi:hypothetical protein